MVFDPSLTDEQLQKIIGDECNVTDDVTVTANIPVWWLMNAYSGASGKELQYWGTRCSVLRYVCGKVRNLIDTQTGLDRVSLSQQFKQAQALLDESDKQLTRLQERKDSPPGNRARVKKIKNIAAGPPRSNFAGFIPED